ncbi:MAG: sensor domain-containing diguanylate cyclase [Elusimicrobiota bacterium]
MIEVLTFFMFFVTVPLLVLTISGYIKVRKHVNSLEHAVKQKDEDLKLINELGVEITSVLDIERLLPKIIDAFARAGKVNKASLMLLDEATGVLEIKASLGLSSRAIEYVRPKLGEGIAGIAASTGKTMLIDDTSRDRVLYKEYIDGTTNPRPVESLLALPLIFKGKVIGVINLDSKITGEPFIRNDAKLLSILASQAAVAITNAQLYNLAITDGLTKLYIHRYFQMRLSQEVDRAKRYNMPLTLIMLDIDKFKVLNDTYGHQVGDLVLVSVSKAITATLRSSDIAARYGGEEFAVVLTETDIDDAVYVAERLRKTVEDNVVEAGSDKVKAQISLGISSLIPSQKDVIDKDELIRRADAALYYSKQQGRNRYTVYDKIGDTKK